MTGRDIRNWREERFLTREQLALLLNMSHRTLETWEQERRAIPDYFEAALETADRRLNEILQLAVKNKLLKESNIVSHKHKSSFVPSVGLIEEIAGQYIKGKFK